MKKIFRDKILNLPGTDNFDTAFLFEYLSDIRADNGVELIYMRDILGQKKNHEILDKVQQKPAMFSEVYSPKDELEIFTELFENAISENKKIHIVGVTLAEEIKMLEEYYQQL